MVDISVIYVAIVRNDDPAKVIAAEACRAGLPKATRKQIKASVRLELGKAAGTGQARPMLPIDPPSYLCSYDLDLSTVGGRPWACVVCATASYLEGNALACAKDIARQLEDSMENQQELEAWARKAKGGSVGGLTKSFSWLDGVRDKWAKQTKEAEILRDTELLKVRLSACTKAARGLPCRRPRPAADEGKATAALTRCARACCCHRKSWQRQSTCSWRISTRTQSSMRRLPTWQRAASSSGRRRGLRNTRSAWRTSRCARRPGTQHPTPVRAPVPVPAPAPATDARPSACHS